MTERTRIFICHRKKTADGLDNNSAAKLYRFLCKEPQYQVWIDEGLEAGIAWEKTIYENLLSSHVLILALGIGTSDSDWVKRELSLAASFGIQIVPVGLDISEKQLQTELKNLDLGSIHFTRPFSTTDATAGAIVSDLEPAINFTAS